MTEHNPLLGKEGKPLRQARIDEAVLHSHVAYLNNFNWVRDSGLPYFVNKRLNAENVYEHFVDRKIAKA